MVFGNKKKIAVGDKYENNDSKKIWTVKKIGRDDFDNTIIELVSESGIVNYASVNDVQTNFKKVK